MYIFLFLSTVLYFHRCGMGWYIHSFISFDFNLIQIQLEVSGDFYFYNIGIILISFEKCTCGKVGNLLLIVLWTVYVHTYIHNQVQYNFDKCWFFLLLFTVKFIMLCLRQINKPNLSSSSSFLYYFLNVQKGFYTLLICIQFTIEHM